VIGDEPDQRRIKSGTSDQAVSKAKNEPGSAFTNSTTRCTGRTFYCMPTTGKSQSMAWRQWTGRAHSNRLCQLVGMQ